MYQKNQNHHILLILIELYFLIIKPLNPAMIKTNWKLTKWRYQYDTLLPFWQIQCFS